VEKIELKMSERSHRSVCDGQAWSFPEAILFGCFVGNPDQGVFSNRFVILSAAKNPAGDAMRFRGAEIPVDSSLRSE
jgi:hypothetical protein